MEILRLTILFLIFAYCLGATRAQCYIEFIKRYFQNIYPIFSKTTIEKKKLILPPNQTFLILEDGEEVTAHCSSGISFSVSNYPHLGMLNTNLSIECYECGCGLYDPDEHSRRPIYNTRRSIISIKCNNAQLFESYTALEGCTNFSSLRIGALNRYNEKMFIAGICFDFDTLTTKYVKYLAHSPKNHFVFENKNNSSGDFITSLDKPLQSLEILFKEFDALNIDFIGKQRENPLLALHKYGSIIQDDRILAEIENIAYMLNIIWWQNLRLGSWIYFLDALHKRTEEVEYIIYTGTSGKLTIPSATNDKENEFMRTNTIIDVPEIIWTYVKPVKANKNDEFVVYAYNTPFYSADNETISCKDVCNEIGWLANENFKKIRLLPTFGVMHCCRVHEIASQLDVFPLLDENN